MGGVISAYLPGTVSGNLNVTGSVNAGSSPGGPVPELVATTGAAGFALQNGTPNIISWTAPNDGLVHRAQIFGSVNITVAETGGAIKVAMTDPGGSAHNFQITGGGSGVGGAAFTAAAFMVAPGSTVTVAQSSALTLGAGVAFAEIWAS